MIGSFQTKQYLCLVMEYLPVSYIILYYIILYYYFNVYI
jgi:hypothetical protein